MKISNMGAFVESSGVETLDSFKIARTPHMFNILSSGLYSDKVAAVLREVGCNAVDAHIMGGEPDRPIQVKLPSTLDRMFYVKDWGPGLDDHEVRTMYTTYGWSNKQVDDSMTGGFGLGSKSPFAYTAGREGSRDGFTVVAAKDGVKRTYTCYIGEDGAPQISRMDERPADADWPHGLMVTFPVRENDIQTFHTKAIEVFSWFRVHPEILGLSGKLRTCAYDKTLSEYARIRPTDVPEKQAAPCVVMGGVRYPLDLSKLGLRHAVIVAMTETQLCLTLPIGSVRMTPSREQLQYTPETTAKLAEAVHAAFARLGELTLEASRKLPGEKELPWRQRWHSWVKALPSDLQMRTGLSDLLSVAGVPHPQAKELAELGASSYAALDKCVTSADGVTVRFITKRAEVDTTLTSYTVLGGKIYTANTGAREAMFRIDEPMTLVWSDQSDALALARAWLKGQSGKRAMLLFTGAHKSDYDAAKNRAEVCANTGTLEGAPVKAVSELTVGGAQPAVTRAPSLKKTDSPAVVFQDTPVFLWRNGTSTQVALKDVPLDCRYYLVSNERGRFNKKEDDVLEMKGTPGIHFKLLTAVTGWFDFQPLAGWIEFPSTRDILRLRMDAQGYKPYLWALREQLGACRDKAAAHFDKISAPHFVTSAWEARTSLVQHLLYLARQEPAANAHKFQQFIDGLDGHPLGDVLMELHKKYGRLPNGFEAGRALNALLSSVNLGVVRLQLPAIEMERLVLSIEPGLQWLAKDWLVSSVQARPFETGQQLRGMLDALHAAEARPRAESQQAA